MNGTLNAQQPVAWLYDFSADNAEVLNWVTIDPAEAALPGNRNVRPLYAAPQPAPNTIARIKRAISKARTA